MQQPPSDLPALLQRYIEAKRAVDASATPDELAEARAWQRQQRQRASARAEGKKAYRRNLVQRAFLGESAAEIAEALGVHERTAQKRIADLGLPKLHRTRPCRTPPLALTQPAMTALEKLADDRKTELARAIVELLEMMAEDGARAARRYLRMPTQQ